MKHLKSFESFDQANESFLINTFNVIKSKINSLLEATVSQYVVQGIDYIQNNPNSEEVINLVNGIENLSEEDKVKLFKLTESKNLSGIFGELSGSMYESMNLNFANIKKILSKIAGYGIILASLFQFVYKIASTIFVNSSIAKVSFLQSNTFGVICLIIGLVVGAILLYKDKNVEEAE